MTRFQTVRACVFDAYGTLVDVHSAAETQRARLGDLADRLSALWRSKQLEYTWVRSLMRRHADFWQVTGEALDYALDALGIADPALRRDLMAGYLRLKCYPDVTAALARLKRNGLRTAILSNGTPAMLREAVQNAGLAGVVDLILSVEDVGIYKPDVRVYRLAPERLGLAAHEIVFLSSNAWDVAGAASAGLPTVWINRAGQPADRYPFGPDAELISLAELPALLGA